MLNSQQMPNSQAVTVMTAKDPLQAAVDAVTEACTRSDQAGSLAKELLPLLKKALDAQGERRPARRDVGAIEYAVEASKEGETLVERRLSGRSSPFRCPKQVYDALVRVLVESDRSMSIDDLIAAIEKKVGFRPAEFQVRVALRFWLYRTPPLIVRNRSRYAALNASDLPSTAQVVWEKISR